MISHPCKHCLKRPMCSRVCDSLKKFLFLCDNSAYVIASILVGLLDLLYIILVYKLLTNFAYSIIFIPTVIMYSIAYYELLNDFDGFMEDLKTYQKVMMILFAGFLYTAARLGDLFSVDEKIENHLKRYINKENIFEKTNN